MNAERKFFTILKLDDSINPTDETTGLCFSPDKKRMLFCQQYEGVCYEVWREDGLSFVGDYLSLKHHTSTPTPVSVPHNVPYVPSDLDLLLEHPYRLDSGNSVTSSSGEFTLFMQSNGNLELRSTSNLVWQIGKSNESSDHFTTFQGDGNVVTRDSTTNKVFWKSDRTGETGVKYFLAINRIENLLIVIGGPLDNPVSLIWSTSLS